MSRRAAAILAITLLVGGLFAPVSVSATGTAPQCVDGAASTNEDVALHGDVGPLCSDAESDPLTYAKLSDPADGTVAFFTDGTYTYTPNANFNGSDSFTFQADDGTSTSAPATVTITVDPVNDPPSCLDDTASGNQDADIHGSVACTDPDGDPLTYSVVGDPSHGTAAFGTGSNYTYSPNANYHGTDSFTFRASDGSLHSNTATASITVNAVNHAPTAVGNSYSVGEDGHLQVAAPGILGNDTDPDGDPLTAVLAGSPAHGDLVLDANGSFSYDPDPNFHGSDSFTYRANDGALNSNVATVSITVTPVNDPPTCSADATSGNEDTVIGGSVPCTDPDGDPLTYSVVADPAHGTAAFGTGPTYTYTPNANYHGTDSFTFRANDGTVDSNTATATITVNPVNDPPICSPDSASTPEDTALIGSVVGLCSDVDGDSLSYAKVGNPAHGSVTVSPNGSYTYTPAANYHGLDSFTYRAGDGTANSTAATITVNVTSVNDPPVCSADSTSGNEDTVISGSVPCSDPDGDPLTYSVVADGSHGTAAFGVGSNYTYTPAANYHGPDSFTFRANDGSLDSNIATATVTVNSVNDAPVCTASSTTTAEDTPKTDTVTCTDVDGDTLSYTKVGSPSHGTASFSGTTSSFTYTPNPNYHGLDSFTFRAGDGTASSNTATVTITVTSVNDPPTCSADSTSGSEDTVIGGSVACTDPDNDPLTYSVVAGTSHGSVAFGVGSTYTYTADANYNGTDSFTFKANDGTVDSNTATAIITITPVNDPPTCASSSTSTPEDIVLVVDLACSDIDGDPLSVYALATLPAHGTAVLGLSGSVTYTPVANYHGPDSFTFTVSDGQYVSAEATASITVTSVNDPPVCAPQTIDVRKDTPKTDAVVCSDVDGDHLTYSTTSSPTHGTLLSFDESTGAIQYKPNDNFIGLDSFRIQASDATAPPVAGIVTLDVRADPYARPDGPLSDPPVPAIAQGSGPVAIDVLANDVDLDPADVIKISRIKTAPNHGRVVITGGGTGLTYDPTGYYAGPDDFEYEIRDLDGNTSRAFVTLTVARAKPRVAAPAAAFSAGGTMIGSSVPVRVAWSLVDDGTGVRRYGLQERRNSGSYATVRLSGASSRSAARSIALGSRWTYRSRLTDTAGNVGAWATGRTFTIVRYQESGVVYTGSWGTSSSSSFSGGKARFSSSTGAAATFSFTGSAIGFVSSKGSTRGAFRVFIDGVYAGAVSLHASRSASRLIAFSRTFGSVGNHVIRLEVVGTAGHPRVDVDAFLVIR